MKTMKTRKMLVMMMCSLVLGGLVQNARADDSEQQIRRQAIDQAIGQVAQSLDNTDFPGVKSIAVLPILGQDSDYATTVLQNAVTDTHYKLFTRDDGVWKTLLAEIEWGVNREDVMDAATIQKFGKINGVSAIMYGRVWDSSVNMWSIRARAKVSVQLASVETGQVLWSSQVIESESFIHWSDAVTKFWKYPSLLIAGLAAMLILLVVLRKIAKAIAEANRPR